MGNAQGPIRASHTRCVVHRVHHAVPLRLSLPCMRKDTTGHGGPATRGRRLQPATAGAPTASGAGGQSAPRSADRSARWLIRRRHRVAPALCGAANPLAGPAWLAAVARARAVDKVRLSAQPPADRSVQRLRPRRHWTAPAPRWAARHRFLSPRGFGNALERTLRLASPIRPLGLKKEGTGAALLCPCHCFLPPRNPL